MHLLHSLTARFFDHQFCNAYTLFTLLKLDFKYRARRFRFVCIYSFAVQQRLSISVYSVSSVSVLSLVPVPQNHSNISFIKEINSTRSGKRPAFRASGRRDHILVFQH